MELKIKVWFERAQENPGVIHVSTFFAHQDYTCDAYSFTYTSVHFKVTTDYIELRFKCFIFSK